MRYALSVIVAIGMLAGGVAPRGVAIAQPADAKALAEQLFNQARDLAKQENWEEACPKFEASFRYDPVLGTKLNLANCYERTGKLASAWGLYRDAVELARKAADIKRADYAQKQAAALEPRLPTLSISLAAGSPAGLLVKRDGDELDAGALGAALYVDPGVHVIEVDAPGFQSFHTTVTLAERQKESVEIPALTPLPVQPQVTEAPPPPEPTLDVTENAPPPPPRTRLYLGIGVGAAGLAAVGTGLVFGVKAGSTNDEAKDLCGAELECSAANYDRGRDLVDKAKSQATISTALVIGGGVAIAAGAVLALTAPRAKERTTAAKLVPTAHERGAGLAVLGSF